MRIIKKLFFSKEDSMDNRNISTNDELGNKERKKLVMAEIVKYITNHREEETYIENKLQIYKDLKKQGKTFGISQQAMYRYFKELKLAQIDKGRFDFPTIGSYSLDTLIKFQNYNQMLCFKPNEMSLGSYIADNINSYYQDFSKDVHCIFLHDILLCLYNDKKIDLATLKKEIKQTLRNYSIKVIL